MKRQPPDTEPPTYTAGEVSRILKGTVSEVILSRWDGSGIFRPSYYYAGERLLTPSARDATLRSLGISRGNPERRYTYQDLVWLRLLIYVKDHLVRSGVRNSARRGGEVLRALRKRTGDFCPSAARVIFVGKQDVYFLDDKGVAERLSDDRQLAMRTLLTDAIFAEVKGRIAVLEARQDIRAIRAGNGGQ